MRAVLTQPDAPFVVHRELNTTTPAKPVSTSRDLLDHDLAIDLREPMQLLGDHRGLEPALRLGRHVLPVAAPALTRSRERARRLHSVGRGSQHLHGVGPQEAIPSVPSVTSTTTRSPGSACRTN